MDNAKLYRFFIINVKKNHIIAKDVFGKKYIINITDVSKKFKIGFDYSFYGFEETKGLILKKNVITPISDEEYAKLTGEINKFNDSLIFKKLKNF